jgi:hypothetical protein
MNKQWHIQSSQTDSITKYAFPFIIGTRRLNSSSISANTDSNAATDFWNDVGQILSLNVKDILKEMSSPLQSDY